MSWFGKFIGGTLGFAVGGPLGAILGTVFGHAYDTSSGKYLSGERVNLSVDQQAQATFFVAAFSMLAKIAKVDGRISEAEIASVEKFVRNDLNLNRESREIAINIFRTAINAKESFQDFAAQFYNTFQSQPSILELMIDILLRVSVADGALIEKEEALILSAVRMFGINDRAYKKLKAIYVKDSDKYYAILGCSDTDSDDQIKKQYRKLVSEYHPDKIASKGLPEEFIKFANDKFREIREAYEAVKEERNFK